MQVGILIFPNMTQLDFTAPYEVFRLLNGVKINIIAKTLEPIIATGGLRFLPDITIADCPKLDLILIPGGPDVSPLMTDLEVLNFLRQQAEYASYITSVCTGALVLGAVGLLRGFRATTHWLSLDLLPYFGAIATPSRVVIDQNRITGGGITAGIDFALQVASEIFGEDEAKRVQLLLEYNPAPPFQSGHPSTADPELVALLRKQYEPRYFELQTQIKQTAELFD